MKYTQHFQTKETPQSEPIPGRDMVENSAGGHVSPVGEVAERAREVRAALTRLDGEQREAIELAYFGGLSYRETALQLGLPEGTIKSRIRIGLGRLRDVLQGSFRELQS